MTIATETCFSAQNIFFLSCRKNLFLHVVMMEQVTDWGFLAFCLFENEQKFRRKCKNTIKNLKFGKKWVFPSQIFWNVRTYHHHTSYYANLRFPIINTNHFVIHRCEFYLFLNRTVLFICFVTNLSSMQKLSLFQKLRKYNFIASVKRHRVYKS